jgi:hypothetical protein
MQGELGGTTARRRQTGRRSGDRLETGRSLGNPSPIEVKLFSDDAAAARQAAVAATAVLAGVPGVVDEFDGITEVGPTYQVEVEERGAALAGLDAGLVQQWLETAITGTVVGRFYRGRDETEPGSGLGLSIAQAIAHAHGGTVTLTNRDSRGCAAIVSLPRRRSEARQPLRGQDAAIS